MKGIWIPLSGAIAQQQNVETIANNIANANTPGFKRDQQVFKEYLTQYHKDIDIEELPKKEWRPEDFYQSRGSEWGYVQTDGTFTDFDQGPLVPTGNVLDLAIQGQGMFEVLGPNGIRYTRKGNFSLSQDGYLVTDQGYPVLSALDPASLTPGEKTATVPGAPLPPPPPQPQERVITLGQGQISINQQGEIYLNGVLTGQLSVAEFVDSNALKKEGNSLYLNPDNQNIVANGNEKKFLVHQGFMEGSNVNAVTEMSNLIKAHRQFESIQKALKAYDHMAEKAAIEIGKY